jgi:uncharacterized protein (TIGR02453 family)
MAGRTIAMMSFHGFTDETFRFYEELAVDNTRAFWTANKHRYETHVRTPMLALLAEFPELGPFHLFRPHRDVRFAADKTPYKDHQGAYAETEGGAGHYVQISAGGLMVGAGYYQMASDQLARFRSAVDHAPSGMVVAGLAHELARSGFQLGAIDELKTAPRGYPRDHPRIELLRRKGLIATRLFPPAGWMATRTLVRRVSETWLAVAELDAWLDDHVGPSTLPPDEGELARFGPL